MCDVCKIIPEDQTCNNCHKGVGGIELCDECFKAKLKKLEKYGLRKQIKDYECSFYKTSRRLV